jgi:hypothetical protein
MNETSHILLAKDFKTPQGLQYDKMVNERDKKSKIVPPKACLN